MQPVSNEILDLTERNTLLLCNICSSVTNALEARIPTVVRAKSYGFSWLAGGSLCLRTAGFIMIQVRLKKLEAKNLQEQQAQNSSPIQDHAARNNGLSICFQMLSPMSKPDCRVRLADKRSMVVLQTYTRTTFEKTKAHNVRA